VHYYLKLYTNKQYEICSGMKLKALFCHWNVNGIMVKMNLVFIYGKVV
jgi:hypothetical protein